MEKKTDKALVFLAKVYYKIKDYFFITDFNGKHLIFEIENWKPKISLIEHDELVEKIREKIENFQKKEKKIEKVINFALKEARENCNYIIFSDSQKEVSFVQYWTMKKKLMFIFPIYKTNNHKKYQYQVLGLLAWFGFNNEEGKPSFLDSFFSKRPYYSYALLKKGKETLIKADFIKNANLAAEFTIKAFKEIYKTDPKRITITIQ